MGIEYNRYNAKTITPLKDRKLFKKIFPSNGIFEGLMLTHLGSNQVSIAAGVGIIEGGDFNVTSETLLVQLSTSGTMSGRIYIRVNLADTVNPIQILSVCANTLPVLTQDPDFNNSNGIWEEELATYTASTTAISGLTRTITTINSVQPTITLNVTCDSTMYGKTVTLTQGTTVLSAVVPTSPYQITFTVPTLGDWVLYNPSTLQSETIPINYYGNYYKTILSYKTYTVVIDTTNSNPTTALSYADDAIGMTAGSSAWDTIFGYKPVLFINGAVSKYLNPLNYSQDISGNAVDITTLGNDVMIQFPKMGYRILTEGTNLKVSITNNPNKAGFVYYPFSRLAQGDKDYFYFGAYKGYFSTYVYSSSGKTPSASVARAGFRGCATARGTGYSLTGFYQYVYLQCLFLLKYKSRDSQGALGQGYVGGTAIQTTGVTNTNGLNYGLTGSALGRVKCFGIEDLWGNIYDAFDGLLTNTSCKVLATYIPSNFNDTGVNHTELFTLTANISGYQLNSVGDNNAGFLPKGTTYGSSTTGYCDNSVLNYNSANVWVPWVGGSYSSAYASGIFNITIATGVTQGDGQVGERIMYV